MQNRSIKPGRPKGKRTFEEEPAKAFGAAVLSMRLERQIAQETLANIADIERSHMSKIERGKHAPTLAMIFRIASALGCSAAELIAEAEVRLKLGGMNETAEGDR